MNRVWARAETPSGVAAVGRQWPIVSFGDVVEAVQRRVDPKTSGLKRYLAGEHLDTDDLRVRRWGSIGDGYLGPAFYRHFKAGETLYVSRRTYLRKVAVPDFDGVCSEKTFVFAPRDTRLLREFLPHLLRTELFHAYSIAKSRGSVNPYVNWRELARFQFRLPPVGEQARIAGVLAAALDCVECWRGVTANAQTLSRSHRHEFFSRESPMLPLAEVAETQLGKMLSPKARNGPDQRPYLGNVAVRWRGFELGDLKTMHFDPAERERFRLRPGDVLVCEGGEVGRAAIWAGELEECYYQKALHRLRVQDSRVTPEYLVDYLRWTSEAGRLGGLVGDSVIAHLTEEKLRRLPVPVPEEHARRRFETAARAVDRLARTTRAHLAQLGALERQLSESLLGRTIVVH